MRKFAPIVFTLLITILSVHQANAQAVSYSIAPRSDAYRADPAVNNYLSAVYDHRLQVDPRFRAYRKWKECHTITWPGLYPDCIASFDQYEPVLYRTY